MKYENYQFKFYESGIKKLREARRLRIQNFHLTDKEKNAIDYFKGTGSYQKYQRSGVKPNIFYRRRSFLVKMHDPKLLLNCLEISEIVTINLINRNITI
jgi:hypothetical protein